MSLDIWIRCEHCDSVLGDDCMNITHNLGKMADAAGIYDCLWRPDENEIKYARQMIDPLQRGLAKLEADPARFEALNSPNGWGLYENFVPFVRRVLAVCENHPGGLVEVSR